MTLIVSLNHSRGFDQPAYALVPFSAHAITHNDQAYARFLQEIAFTTVFLIGGKSNQSKSDFNFFLSHGDLCCSDEWTLQASA